MVRVRSGFNPGSWRVVRHKFVVDIGPTASGTACRVKLKTGQKRKFWLNHRLQGLGLLAWGDESMNPLCVHADSSLVDIEGNMVRVTLK